MTRHIILGSLMITALLWANSTSAQTGVITINSPKEADCVAGGTPLALKWSTDTPGPDRLAIGVSTAGQELGQWKNNPSDYFVATAPNSGTYNWNVPNITTSNAKLTFEGQMSDGSVWGRTSSSSFAIDADPPTKVSLSLISKTESSVTLEWQPQTSGGCAPLLGYKLFVDKVNVKTLETISPNTITLGDLAPNSNHTFRLDAYDSLVTMTGTELTVPLGTAGVTATATPTTPFSKITASQITDTQATITFTSDQERDVTIDYGLTEKYGRSTSVTKKLVNEVWTYSVTLEDLTENSTYHFRLRTKTVTSSSSTFKTKLGSTEPAPTASVTSIAVGSQEITATKTAKVVENEQIVLTGTTKPNTKVVITVYSKVRTYEIVSDSAGNWTFGVDTQGLESGDHHVTVATKDSKGKTGKSKQVLKFQLLPKAKAAPKTITIPDASAATQFGHLYGRIFIWTACIGTAVILVTSRINQRKKNIN